MEGGDEFTKWFPALARRKGSESSCKFRLVCFPGAGNTEKVFTSAGTGERRVSTLIDFCNGRNIEIVGVQLPARENRRSEENYKSAQEAASALLPHFQVAIRDAPYAIIAHSMGTLIAFELLIQARRQGVRLPERCFFSSFPAPDIAEEEKPWRRNKFLSDAEFAGEAREWSVNEEAFKMWKLVEPLLRSDFTLFDEYQFSHDDEPPLPIPFKLFLASQDKRIKRHHLLAWQRWSTEAIQIEEIENAVHVFPTATGDQRQAKEQWLQSITADLQHLDV